MPNSLQPIAVPQFFAFNHILHTLSHRPTEKYLVYGFILVNSNNCEIHLAYSLVYCQRHLWFDEYMFDVPLDYLSLVYGSYILCTRSICRMAIGSCGSHAAHVRLILNVQETAFFKE